MYGRILGNEYGRILGAAAGWERPDAKRALKSARGGGEGIVDTLVPVSKDDVAAVGKCWRVGVRVPEIDVASMSQSCFVVSVTRVTFLRRVCARGVDVAVRAVGAPVFTSTGRFSLFALGFGKIVATDLVALLGTFPAAVNTLLNASGTEAASGVGESRVKSVGLG